MKLMLKKGESGITERVRAILLFIYFAEIFPFLLFEFASPAFGAHFCLCLCTLCVSLRRIQSALDTRYLWLAIKNTVRAVLQRPTLGPKNSRS